MRPVASFSRFSFRRHVGLNLSRNSIKVQLGTGGSWNNKIGTIKHHRKKWGFTFIGNIYRIEQNFLFIRWKTKQKGEEKSLGKSARMGTNGIAHNFLIKRDRPENEAIIEHIIWEECWNQQLEFSAACHLDSWLIHSNPFKSKQSRGNEWRAHSVVNYVAVWMNHEMTEMWSGLGPSLNRNHRRALNSNATIFVQYVIVFTLYIDQYGRMPSTAVRSIETV